MSQQTIITDPKRKKSYLHRLALNIIHHKWAYLMLIPVVAYYILFHYGPLYGVQIAFKDFSPGKGITGSKWVGFKHFISFFQGVYFTRTIRNTLAINIYGLIWGFPAPIILALLLDEVHHLKFKKLVQTVTYLPHFISTVVICGILSNFCQTNGLFNNLAMALVPGYEKVALLSRPELFRTLYIGSNIWQSIGWNSIIFIAALAGVDAELYDAIAVDGGNRWHRVRHVSIPCILPTVVIMLIMRIGNMMSVGSEKIILMYNESTYEVADVISTYVYRRGLLEFAYSFSAAVGLFNNIINFILVNIANSVSRKVTETSLW